MNETSPTADPKENPRATKLLNAEEIVVSNGGLVLRLAGLYSLERGAHAFWLKKSASGVVKDVKGREDGIINLVNYDDAAGACVAALRLDQVSNRGGDSCRQMFLISDGNPTTRGGICSSALRSTLFQSCSKPQFLGGPDDNLGKVYDGSISNAELRWKAVHQSFDAFMSSS